MQKVSIQGIKGSFHHIAAESLLPADLQLNERKTFAEVFDDLEKGDCEAGVVATRNTIFGDIKEVLKLLKTHPHFEIVNTLDLSIQQNLIVIPGTQLRDLKEVHSQLPALTQCQEFLRKNAQLKQVETADTALSVKEMMEKNDKTVAAIGSDLAAKLYGAEILISHIQDSSTNITTFILLRKKRSLAAKRMDHLTEYFFARAAVKISEVKKQKEIINLGMGNPDLPLPPNVTESLIESVQQPDNHLYPPYTGTTTFRQGISKWYEQHFQKLLNPETEILPVGGSKQAIFQVSLAFLEKGDEVLIPNPGYSAYEKAAVVAGATPRFYELSERNGFLPDLTGLEKLDLSKVKLFWISYPHNPTGATITANQLAEIVEFAERHNLILVNDNPYSHVTFNGYKAPSLVTFLRKDSLLLELSSLSKTYNMPGWRLGWIVGNQKLISVIKNLYGNMETGQFIPMQIAATMALLTSESWISERNQIYAKRREILINIFEKLNCEVFTSDATLYVWAKIPKFEKNAEQFVFSLLERTGIFLAPGTAFGTAGEGFVRGAICQSEEILRRALAKI